MPSMPRPGSKGVYIELPERLLALLRERAAKDRRKMKATVLLAIEQYLGVTPEQYQNNPPAGDDVETPPTKGKRKK